MAGSPAALQPRHSRGLVRSLSLDELDELDRQKAETQPAVAAPAMDGLAKHILRCFEEAQNWRAQNLDDRLLTCQRARNGEYSPTTLAQIQAQGGNDVFFNITELKCATAEAWIHYFGPYYCKWF